MKSFGVYTFQDKITRVLTRLHGCADLSAPLLFAHMLRNEVRQSSLGIIRAQNNISTLYIHLFNRCAKVFRHWCSCQYSGPWSAMVWLLLSLSRYVSGEVLLHAIIIINILMFLLQSELHRPIPWNQTSDVH